MQESIIDYFNDSLEYYTGISLINIKRLKVWKYTSKDYALSTKLCTENNECPTLELNYDDNEYGSKRTLNQETKSINNADKNKTYYCKGSDCYKYEDNKATEISGSCLWFLYSL